MKNAGILALVLLVTGLAGCVQDPTTGDDDSEAAPLPYGGAVDDNGYGRAPTGFLPDPVLGLEHLQNPDPYHAYSVYANDNVLYVAGDPGLRTFNLTDPGNVQPYALDVAGTASRDIDLLFHPDERLYAVLAHNREDGILLVDVTDPREPHVVSQSTKCTHNIAVVPGTTLVYSSFSACHTGDMAQGDNSHLAIVDFADPQNPVETLVEFPDTAVTVGGVPRAVTAISCHHTTFQMDRNLAYCAGITQTLVFDIEDPLAPVIVQVIDWPGNNVHHAVWPAHGGDLLLIGDEVTAALGPTPTCSQTLDYPTSALWFFDLSDLALPTPVGYYQADHYDALNQDALQQTVEDRSVTRTATYCTTHFGGFVEDRDLFVISWYTAGTILLDFSDPTNPFTVASYRADGRSVTTDAIYYKGHVYAADEERGLDVLQIV